VERLVVDVNVIRPLLRCLDVTYPKTRGFSGTEGQLVDMWLDSGQQAGVRTAVDGNKRALKGP